MARYRLFHGYEGDYNYMYFDSLKQAKLQLARMKSTDYTLFLVDDERLKVIYSGIEGYSYWDVIDETARTYRLPSYEQMSYGRYE